MINPRVSQQAILRFPQQSGRRRLVAVVMSDQRSGTVVAKGRDEQYLERQR